MKTGTKNEIFEEAANDGEGRGGELPSSHATLCGALTPVSQNKGNPPPSTAQSMENVRTLSMREFSIRMKM